MAVVMPPLIVLPIGRLHRRFSHNAAVRGFVRGIVLVVAAIVPLVFLRVIASYGLGLRDVLIIASAIAILASRRAPVIVVMAVSSIAGLLFYR